MAYQVEVTDTFGGEANYAWVRRYHVEAGSDLAIIRAAKRAAGWSGLRCATTPYDDGFEVRPIGRNAPCWIMFIQWTDEAPEPESDSE